MSKYIKSELSIRKKQIIDINTLLFSSIVIYLQYTTWFQYSFFPLNGLLSIVGLIMLSCILILLDYKNIQDYKVLGGFFFFLLFSGVTGFFVTPDIDGYVQVLFKILEYCIPMFAIVVYVGGDEFKYRNVMKAVYITAIIAAIESFRVGVTVNTGAITIRGINSNVLSSNLMIGIMAGLYLLVSKKGIKEILFGLPLVLLLFSQINAASRRGFIIALILFAIYISLTISKKYMANRRMQILLVCICAIVLALFISHLQDLSQNVLVFRRIAGEESRAGDQLREQYQKIAISMFESNPIIGKGFNALTLSGSVYSHSLYYELLACTGICGFIILISYLISFSISFWNDSRTLKSSREFMISSRLESWYVFATLITGIAVVLLYDSYFYVIVGILASYSSIIQTNKHKIELNQATNISNFSQYIR